MSDWKKHQLTNYITNPWWKFWLPKRQDVTFSFYFKGDLDLSRMQIEVSNIGKS